MVKLWGLAFTGLLLLSACAEGTSETDRQARTLADAISHPRQLTAAGFAKAALATKLGQSTESFSILEFTDRKVEDISDPLAHLVIRIHHLESDGGLHGGSSEAVTACYGLDFNYYGIMGEPKRIACPDKAAALTPPQRERRYLEGSYDNAIDAALATLPAVPTETDVRAALTKTLPPSEKVGVTFKGADVGVSVYGSDANALGMTCVVGSRVNGAVTVWRPEKPYPCEPQNALS
jgi:hypothetical protein